MSTVADYLVEVFRREGVECVFAVPGALILPIMQALAKAPRIRVVICKTEMNAAYMASGYCDASGKVGVILTIGGPGAAGAVAGLCVARAQCQSIVMISGEVSNHLAGRRAAQDSTALGVDIAAITRTTTALSVHAGSADEALTAIDEAYRRAAHLRMPTHVALPMNIQHAIIPETWRPRARVALAPVMTWSREGVHEAAKLLRGEGKKVALLVGRGAKNARAEVAALVERLGAPVATTVGGKGIVDEHHPAALGVFSFGGGPLGRGVLTSGLDVLLVIGSSLGEFATMNYSEALIPKEALIQIDHDPSAFGRTYDCVPVCGDAREVCRALLAELGGEGSRALPSWFLDMKAKLDWVAQPAMLTATSVPMRPERLMREIEAALPADAALVVDIGTSTLFAAHCLRLRSTQTSFIPLAWSAMCHPLAAALGVRLGSGRPTVCIAGDSAFLGVGLEIHTAVEQGVPRFVCVVLSNRGHGLVRLGTAAILGSGHGVEDGTFRFTPDIAAIARAVGAAAVTVHDPAELAAALDYALTCGRPCVIDVHVDPEAAPPMGDRIQELGKR